MAPLKFGLVGTGHWARIAHAPALATTEGIALTAVALGELAGNIRSGQRAHPCDASFGRDVGRVISEAQRQLDARKPGRGGG